MTDMSGSGGKYYVVWEGYDPGIYNSWAECQLQIKGYPNAKYKSFKSKIEAEEAFSGGAESKSRSAPGKRVLSGDWKSKVPPGSITVDAACEGNPGVMEYRAVDPYSGKVIFHQGPFRNGTNNIGEFLALVHALAMLKKAGDAKTAVYTDSRTAMSWLRNRKVKTTLQFDHSNRDLQDLLKRAVQWLNDNQYSNPVVKWDTENWGEIPADFGRK